MDRPFSFNTLKGIQGENWDEEINKIFIPFSPTLSATAPALPKASAVGALLSGLRLCRPG